jgi:exodeoxyribonuclease V gamma subunit
MSWTGRSQRDNQSQPPSVLVSQWCDYLEAGWGKGVVADRTTDHPLQPFSRRYFEPAGTDPQARGLYTYAAEWRSVHEAAAAADALPAPAQARSRSEAAARQEAATVAGLANFLRNPVKAFFQKRLQVNFDERSAATEDDERFVTTGLDRWQLLDEALSAIRREVESSGASPGDGDGLVRRQVARLQRAGRLPLAGPGARVQDELIATLHPMVSHWQVLQAQHAQARDKWPLRWQHPARPGLDLDDWLVGLQVSGVPGTAPVWIELLAARLADPKGEIPRADKLLTAWVRSLASAACGQPVGGILIGANAVVRVAPLEPGQAQDILGALTSAWQEGVTGDRPWATAVNTGLAFLKHADKARAVYDGGDFGGARGEGREPCLARLYPDFSALVRDPTFVRSTETLYGPYGEWLDRQVTVEKLPESAVAAEALDD